MHRVPAAELVPGDIIDIVGKFCVLICFYDGFMFWVVGDKIPADCRLMEVLSSAFRVDQSILTGESVSVTKETIVVKDKQAVKQDMINIVFSVSTHWI